MTKDHLDICRTRGRRLLAAMVRVWPTRLGFSFLTAVNAAPDAIVLLRNEGVFANVEPDWMMNAVIGRSVALCVRHAGIVITVGILLAVGSATYAAKHFAINTDVTKLIAPDLPWRQRELAYQEAFPETRELILAIVRAPTPELASIARERLLDELFRSVHAPDGGRSSRATASSVSRPKI